MKSLVAANVSFLDTGNAYSWVALGDITWLTTTKQKRIRLSFFTLWEKALTALTLLLGLKQPNTPTIKRSLQWWSRILELKLYVISHDKETYVRRKRQSFERNSKRTKPNSEIWSLQASGNRLVSDDENALIWPGSGSNGQNTVAVFREEL